MLVQIHHVVTTVAVRGRVIATYTHHGTPSADFMPKTEERYVPGRKTIVKAAMVFIDELSALVSLAIKVVVALSCCVTRLKTYTKFVSSLGPRWTGNGYEIHCNIFSTLVAQ